jgi:hypothetical protein
LTESCAEGSAEPPAPTTKVSIKGTHADYIERVRAWLNARSPAWWAEQGEDYPRVDCKTEAKDALGWLKTNQKRRADVLRFFRNWFAKSARTAAYRRERGRA